MQYQGIYHAIYEPEQFRRGLFKCILFFLCSLFTISVIAQTSNQDSLNTPFRKGRWLTGLSGSIGSNTNKTNSSEEKTTTNEFGLNLSTGIFIKDRWLLGGSLSADRSETAGSIDGTTESIFIAPFLSYYLSPNDRGSLFVSISPGYVLYRDETTIIDPVNPVEQRSEGGGFGSLLGLGYSYVIHDRIAFDIGFDVNLFWIRVDERLEPQGTLVSENLSISNISFNFGFNVLLDDFFF
ncbi:outer membrane beta-barrel protein [Poritiphilus flavus]|uniref:Outer membrane beta-barrel protein n=1 Tax=Poritiphilus flavus TaxID=2697053 RepID=A0A6L9ECQ6_9FLAO|nr:outer membrane beta-barrel protein [Poritiphilus flavus]NAS12534.1 outer membrane beta-barrel protein [Poritiphilus flavus]